LLKQDHLISQELRRAKIKFKERKGKHIALSDETQKGQPKTLLRLETYLIIFALRIMNKNKHSNLVEIISPVSNEETLV
jgi:hypothetical protein